MQLDAPVLSSMRTVLKDLAFKAQLLQAGRSEGRRSQRGASFLALGTDAASMSDSLLSVFQSDREESDSVPLEFAQRLLARLAC